MKRHISFRDIPGILGQKPKSTLRRSTMKANYRKQLGLFLLLIAGPLQVCFAACDQTLSSGANVASAISSAAAGTTICLNSGTYGSTRLSNISKSNDVTIQSTSGKTATISLSLSGSNHLKFQNLTISDMDMNSGGNQNISILNNTFKGQLRVVGSGKNASPANILIDGNTFDNITVCSSCSEGRLQLYNAGGVTVSNNHFGGPGESDGIQWGGYGGTVGPGNVFEGIVQGSYGRHVDAIQLYGQVDNHTITGNYFANNTIYVGAYDGGANLKITNNVFGSSPTNEQKLQLGAIQGLTFTHNTVKGNYVVAQGAKNGMPRNINATYRDNIFVGTKIQDSGDQAGCASGCVYDHNLFSSSSLARGSNNLIGMPTFVGGSNPNTWAGYPLTSSSLGYKAGTDGKDMGATSFGAGTTPPPVSLAPPANLRVQ
jgi:hypothetical protein